MEAPGGRARHDDVGPARDDRTAPGGGRRGRPRASPPHAAAGVRQLALPQPRAVLWGAITIAALVVAFVLSLYVVLLVGYPYGSTAVCVAHDETLLRFHRVTTGLLGLGTVATWVVGIVAIRRSTWWARVRRALLVPVTI